VQNTKPPSLSLVTIDRSSAANVLHRVIAIAPALLPGEKETDYAEVALRIVGAAKPRDAIEEFLIRDAVDLTWEILRLRRAKAGILRASRNTGVEEVMKAVSPDPNMSFLHLPGLSGRWLAGIRALERKSRRPSNKAQLSVDDVTAKTLERKLDSVERLDRMQASVEGR
jgi:hypothetical protein